MKLSKIEFLLHWSFKSIEFAKILIRVIHSLNWYKSDFSEYWIWLNDIKLYSKKNKQSTIVSVKKKREILTIKKWLHPNIIVRALMYVHCSLCYVDTN